MTGDGKCSAHKKVMAEKAALYATAIQCSSLRKGESRLAYNSFYLPSLGYGTTVTTLNQQECYNIQKPVVNAILSKMGISSKSPRASYLAWRDMAAWDWNILLIIKGIAVYNI
jgi:hypothetical protein